MNCNEIVSRNDCESVLLQELNKNSFKLISYEISSFSKHITGFLSTHFRLSCYVQIGNDFKTFSFFLKKELADVDCASNYFSKAVSETKAFRKEILFYNLLVRENILKWAPRYYPLKKESVIILEDLSQKGFRLTNKRDMDLEECTITFRALAAMHAFGIYFESTLSRPFEVEYPDLFVESLYDYDLSIGSDWLNSGSDFTKLALDHFLKKNADEIKRAFDKQLKFEIKKSLKPSDRFKNFMCHRDVAVRNILFRYENGKAKNCVLIDFQLTRYLPPAYDLFFFIYTATTSEFRRKYLYSLFGYYYEQLGKELKSFGLNVVEILPMDDFYKSLQDTIGFVKVVGTIHNQFRFCDKKVYRNVLSTKADSLDMILGDRAEVLLDQLKHSQDFRERYFEVLDEMVEYLRDPINLREQNYDGYRM